MRDPMNVRFTGLK